MIAVVYGLGWALAEVVTPAIAYLLCVGLCWLWCRRLMTDGRAALLAAGLVFSMGVLLPLIGNVKTERAYARATGADVTPTARISLAGDVYLDRIVAGTERSRSKPYRYSPPPYWQMRTCARLCNALLATPGVTSVTVEPTHGDARSLPSPDAVTYRRGTGSCGPSSGNTDSSGDTLGTELATVACVTGWAPVGRADVHIVSFTARQDDGLRNSLSVERVEVLDAAGRAAFRRSRAAALFTAVPLRPVLHAPLNRRPLEIKGRSSGRDEVPAMPSLGALLVAHTTLVGVR